MKKKEAIDRVTAIESELKHLKIIIEATDKKEGKDIKTFEDACEALNIDIKNIFNCTDTKDEISYKKLKIISKAINGNWNPNWNNLNEYKYYPYFNMQSGFRFSTSIYLSTDSFSYVGSPLCFKTRELAEYCGKQFESIYKDLLTLEN